MNQLAPGPGFFSGFSTMRRFRADPLGEMIRLHNIWGDMVRIPVGSLQINLAGRPEFVQDFLVTNAQKYGMSPRYKAMKPLLGNGLLTSEGPGWLSRRRTIQPIFKRDRVSNWDHVFTEACEHTTGRLAKLPADQPIDVAKLMMELTFAIIGRAMFSSDLSTLSDVVYTNLETAMVEMKRRASARIKLPMRWPTPANQRYNKSIRNLIPIVEKLIKDRRAIPENQRPDDLLTLLLSSRDPENPDITLTDEQIRDECTTILVAGHETTANAMSWTWYLLSQNPDQGNRLREECKAVLQGRTPTAKDLPSLPLSEKVILESMRLFPPVWFINRIAHEESEIGPYHIGKGAIVVGSAWKMHRDERWWPNPLQFNPDRFTTGHDDNRHRFAYFPFGGGQKKCIGQSFAMIEAQLILISLVQKFAFELVPDHPVVPRPLVTLSPAHGLPMYVKTME
ncbi:MAG: hypothetical protein CMF59_17845 [Leptospiraceae bacterium]|nr:hypothetical protein [Leptospiraceae bacterium]